MRKTKKYNIIITMMYIFLHPIIGKTSSSYKREKGDNVIMIEILILNDNFNFIKNLVNNTCRIKISGIATSYEEAIDNLKIKNFDLILIEIKQQNINDRGMKFLQYLKDIENKSYTNSIIVITSQINLISQIKDNAFIYRIINKDDILEKLEEEINNYNILENNNEIKNELINSKIVKELEYLGYNLSYVGTTYIKDIIYIIIMKNLSTNFNIKKDIYPYLYKKYKKSYTNVKSNINKVTEIMYYECEECKLEKYFNVPLILEQPKPKYVIAQIVKNILYNK
mgnify:CR=1 FL=1